MAKQAIELRFVATVRLTPVGIANPNGVDVEVSRLLAYSQKEGFTRLQLTRRQTLDVTETTDRIDYLIRRATPRRN